MFLERKPDPEQPIGEIRFPGGVVVRGLRVTPDIAAELLESAREDREDESEFNKRTKVKNRRLRDKHVAELVEPMKRGKFYVTGQGISIDTRSRLIDGQHRLWAILDSGAPQDLIVAFDVNDDAFMVLDEHSKRQFSDVLWASGDAKQTDSKAAITRMLYRIDKAVIRKLDITSANYFHPNNETLSEYYSGLQQQADIDRIVSKTWTVHEIGRGLSPSAAGACIYLGYLLYGESFTDDFFRKLATGLDIKEGDPVNALRQKLPRLHQEYDHSSFKSMALAAHTLKAMKVAWAGKSLKLLRLGNKETFADWV